jgi:hypothetical protein
MRHEMETVYILLEKDLATEYVRVQGVYGSRENAEDTMRFLMDFNEEEKSYKIEEKEMK